MSNRLTDTEEKKLLDKKKYPIQKNGERKEQKRKFW